MYSVSNSIDFYWLIFRGCPEQRAEHSIQKGVFEAIAAHHSVDAARIEQAGADAKYLGSLGLMASVILLGLAIDAYGPRGQVANFWLQLASGVLAFLVFVFAMRLRRLGWRLKHRQMGGWYEIFLPASWASAMREPVTRGPREEIGE